MAQSEAHVTVAIQTHDESLFWNIRYRKTEIDTKEEEKTDKTELIDAYTKTETDDKLDLKLNIVEFVDEYSRNETYA
ncbi:MAG: hypothetical protein EZS28_027874 [Streblomastix strix]|uniref:Uncharacterized protein n=1 Tax=Streblomastix strix TaxID=222440 RepID=A0A5J4V1J1_9EUKA|nr:MAG: hypothetical protein EZS28_027874 [Streblomastix strix]